MLDYIVMQMRTTNLEKGYWNKKQLDTVCGQSLTKWQTNPCTCSYTAVL